MNLNPAIPGHNPLITVIMPVHNAGVYLRAAVESILNQQYSSLELILVDDHSDDGAIERLAIIRDPRLKIVSSQQRGVVNAMHEGFRHAQGDYIARMDADDESLPQRLQTQLYYLQQHEDIGIAGSQVEIFSHRPLDGGLQRYQAWLNNVYEPEDIQRELFIESPMPNPGVMFRREVYERLGGYQDPVWAEDYDAWLRADCEGIRMGKPQGILVRWRDHGKRLTHVDNRYSQRNFMRAKAHYLARHKLKNKTAIIWGTGPNGVLFHDLLKEHGINIKGFIDIHPRRVGGVKRDLPVWSMDVINEISDEVIIGAVGSWGAREKIRDYLEQRGFEEASGYIFVA